MTVQTRDSFGSNFRLQIVLFFWSVSLKADLKDEKSNISFNFNVMRIVFIGQTFSYCSLLSPALDLNRN